LKILLADDHAMFRDSMSVWLKQLDTGLHVEFADSYSSVENLLTGGEAYDLLMLDLGMPGMQGILSLRSLCELASCPVLVVSADETNAAIQSALDADAAGYVPKSASGDEILAAARTVLQGGLYFPEEFSVIDSLFNQLNKKQQQLLGLLAEGNSNKEIAEKLFLSEGTVKQYVSQLFRLLDVDNRTQASIKARDLLRIKTA